MQADKETVLAAFTRVLSAPDDGLPYIAVGGDPAEAEAALDRLAALAEQAERLRLDEVRREGGDGE